MRCHGDICPRLGVSELLSLSERRKGSGLVITIGLLILYEQKFLEPLRDT